MTPFEKSLVEHEGLFLDLYRDTASSLSDASKLRSLI